VLGPTGTPLLWTVIFEFSLPITSTLTLGAWALKWHNLSSLPFDVPGNDQFNTALQGITDLFAATKYTGFVNGIPLNQLRTNEIALGSPWELREFHMNPSDGGLDEAPVKKNPDLSFSTDPTKMADLEGWLVANPGADLPASIDGIHLLGGTAPETGFLWLTGTPLVSGFTESIRHNFALNTCNGCHTNEPTKIPNQTVQATPFTHLSPRGVSQVSSQSSFIQFDTNNNRAPIQQATLIQSFCQ
jgi:hypothetical protein